MHVYHLHIFFEEISVEILGGTFKSDYFVFEF